MTSYEGAPEDVIRWRFREVLEDVKKLRDEKVAVALQQQAQDNRIDRVIEDVKELHEMHAELVEHLDRVNGTLNKLLATIAGSSVLVVLGLLASTQNPWT